MRKKDIGRIIGIAMLLTVVMFVIALAHVSAEDTEAPKIIDGSSDIEGTTGEKVTVWVNTEDNVLPTKGIVYYKKAGTVEGKEENMTRTNDISFPYWYENNEMTYDIANHKIDVGKNAYPTFVDLDDDGDLDMVIGEWDGYLNYYENVGNSTNPSWEKHSEMFNGIDVGGFSTPAFADLDNDGDYDLIVGEADGILNYYNNTGDAKNPRWTYNGRLQLKSGGDIDVGKLSAPALVDLDNDNDLDLVVGEKYGKLKFYENIGNNTHAEWNDSKDFGIDIGYNSTPAFMDLDRDGYYDLIIGTNAGHLVYYRNMRNFVWEKDPSNFSGIDVGIDSAPAFADLDGDEDLDLIIGIGGKTSTSSGQLRYYENMRIYKFSCDLQIDLNDTTDILYSIHIFDEEENVVHYPGELEYFTINVNDNDEPDIVNGSKDVNGTTGEEVKVFVEARDNIAPYQAILYYGYSGSEKTEVTMNKKELENSVFYFYYDISLDKDSIKEILYHIEVMDKAENVVLYKNETESGIPIDYIIYVRDNDSPQIINGTKNIIWSKENATIWIHAIDNIEIKNAYFYYNKTGEKENYTEILMNKTESKDYTNFSFNLTKLPTNVPYYIKVLDAYNNIAYWGNESSPFYISYDKPPIADAGQDQKFNQNESGGVLVFFNGSKSKDDFTKELYYKWNFSDVDSGENILEGYNLTNPSHFYSAPGRYNVTLTVTDERNNSDIDWVIITVIPFIRGTINVDTANVSLRGVVCKETLAKHGQYHLNIEPGRYILHANAPYFYDFNKEIYVLENKNIDQDIVLQPLISSPKDTYIEGVVWNSNRERVKGAKVSLIDFQDPNNPRAISNISDEAGYEIYAYGGNFKLICEHKDYNIYTKIIKIKEGEPISQNITLEPKQTYKIKVEVKNEKGEILKGANVTLYNYTDNFEITNQTNEKGICYINGYEGNFTLRVGYHRYFNFTKKVYLVDNIDEPLITLYPVPKDWNYVIKGNVRYANEPTKGVEGANITLYDLEHDYLIKTQTRKKGYFEMSVYNDSKEEKKFVLVVEFQGLQSNLNFVTLDKLIIDKTIYLKEIKQDIINTTITFADWNNSNVKIKKTLNANIGIKRFEIDRLFGNGDGELNETEVKEWNTWLKELGGAKLDTKNDFKVNETYFEVVEDSYKITISNGADIVTSTKPIIIDISYDTTSNAGMGAIELNVTLDSFDVDYITTISLPKDYEVFSHSINKPINITYPVKRGLGYDVIIDPMKPREEDQIWGGPAFPPMHYEWIILEIEKNLLPVGNITLNESLDMIKDDEYFVVKPGEIIFSANNSYDTFPEWLEYTWYTKINGKNETLGKDSYLIYNFTKTGEYNVWLKLEDSAGAESWTNRTIIVDGTPPTPKITVIVDEKVVKKNFEIDEGKEISFNGSNSIDKKIGSYPGGIYNYSWEFGDGSSENDTIANVSDMATSYTYDIPTRDKNYIVNLTVWDKAGNKATASVEIKVNDITKPKVEFDFNGTVKVNETVTLNATNSTDPEKGKIVKYKWDFGDGGYNNGTNVTITHIYEKAGEYTIILNITDTSGNYKTLGQTIIVEEIPTPDLGVKNITFSNPNPKDGEEITIFADVFNYGDVDVKENVTVKFYYVTINNTKIFIDDVNVTLDKGEEKNVNVTWVATKDAISINLTIDENNKFKDKNLGNNMDGKTIFVEETPEKTNLKKIILLVIVIVILAFIGYRFVFAGKTIPEKKSKKGKKK